MDPNFFGVNAVNTIVGEVTAKARRSSSKKNTERIPSKKAKRNISTKAERKPTKAFLHSLKNDELNPSTKAEFKNDKRGKKALEQKAREQAKVCKPILLRRLLIQKCYCRYL